MKHLYRITMKNDQGRQEARNVVASDLWKAITSVQKLLGLIPKDAPTFDPKFEPTTTQIATDAEGIHSVEE